jgi:hypothetical protein
MLTQACVQEQAQASSAGGERNDDEEHTGKHEHSRAGGSSSRAGFAWGINLGKLNIVISVMYSVIAFALVYFRARQAYWWLQASSSPSCHASSHAVLLAQADK